MAAANTQPTVLVKMANGDSMRMTLDELKAYKKDGTLPAREPASLKPIKQKEMPSISTMQEFMAFMDDNAIDASKGKEVREEAPVPAVVETQALATTTPVVDAFVDHAAAEAWDDEDHHSLLDERLHDDVPDAHTPVSSSTSTMLGTVLKQANVSIDPDLFTRFESIVSARLKDIRGNEETKQYLEKAVEQGGMGLAPEKSDAVLAAIASAEENRPAPAEDLKPVEKQPMAAYVPMHQPLAATQSPVPKIRQSSGRKPVMHDITPVAKKPQAVPLQRKRTVGPVDEIGNMALLDFRRMSTDPLEAIDAVLAKFDVLKQESYLLYLDARKAWFRSPMYIAYKTALVSSVNNGWTLEEGLAAQQGSGQMTESELLAISAINNKLN